MADDKCPECGEILRIGDFPFCSADGHGRSSASVHQDSVEGGYWVENGFSEPRYFESKKAHIDALAAEGKEIRAKWAGHADKHLKRWDAPCATTLANATALLTRSKNTPFATDEDMAEFPIEVTDIVFERES